MMTDIVDYNIISHIGGIEINSLTHVLDIEAPNEFATMHRSSYYDISEFKKLVSSSKKYFSILSLNVQSLNAKVNELEAFINELYIAQFKFNVICLQECWLTNESDASTMQLHGYKCIAQGKHSSERGGLIMYVDDCFQYDIILNINTYEH